MVEVVIYPVGIRRKVETEKKEKNGPIDRLFKWISISLTSHIQSLTRSIWILTHGRTNKPKRKSRLIVWTCHMSRVDRTI